ncbi:MAG: ATP-dependent endonuclease [Acidobacteria bacterium]|nr:ATP-dependent endonuclease [Acidobacteriota bacterium]
MYLSRLFIKNYRSIKELDLTFAKGKNVLVGRNNAGKSNVIKAIDLVLGEYSPTYTKSENITESDFYTWREDDLGHEVVHSANEIFIWCELRRDFHETLNYDEMYKANSLAIYTRLEGWTVDNKPIKQAARISQHSLPLSYEPIFDLNEDNADRDWIVTRKRELQPLEKQFDDKYLYAFAFRATKDEFGHINKDIRFLYREDGLSDWVLAFRAPIRNELLQSAIIPAFRDPGSQLRLNNWTWYGRLMRHLTAGQEGSTELLNAMEHVKNVADKIFAEAKEHTTANTLDLAFPDTELHFQFNTETRADLYKSAALYVDDGYKSQLVDKGSGIQSAVVIGLFQYYTRYVNTITSALLCIEEPELFLHPHARKVISNRLDSFLDNNKHQVILSTHSEEFIRASTEDLHIVKIRKEKGGTRANTVSLKDFRHLLLWEKQNELFFADKVIVCEGYHDFILKAVADELFPGKLEEQNISIISVGSKNYLRQLVNLILHLGIKCFVFADFEFLLRDGAESALIYGAKTQENLLSLDASFFAQDCTFGPAGEKARQFIEKLRTQIKELDESAFYTAKSAIQIAHPNIQQVLDRMRSNGVGILSGELENLSKDYAFLSPSDGLSLEKVYALNERVMRGEKLTDLLLSSEISDFLQVVLAR